MSINFDALNKDLQGSISDPTMTIEQYDTCIAQIELVIREIKRTIKEHILEINRATMKAKDLTPGTSEFNKEIERIQYNLNGVMIVIGGLIPYNTILSIVRQARNLKASQENNC